MVLAIFSLVKCFIGKILTEVLFDALCKKSAFVRQRLEGLLGETVLSEIQVAKHLRKQTIIVKKIMFQV